MSGHTDEDGNCVRENESVTWDSIEEFAEYVSVKKLPF